MIAPSASANSSPLSLCCPDCLRPIYDSESSHCCSECGRTFHVENGIRHMLPSRVAAQDIKDREKAGWQEVYPRSLDEVRQFYMEFPYVTEDRGSLFYQHAAEQMEIAMKLLGPLDGKRGLDLGGGFGWAAYRFTKCGAQMALADYNDSTPSGLGGAQVYADAGISFDRFRVDAEALPFADEQFEFVFSCSFLHHLTDPGKAIAHVGRILKPGGRYVATMEAFCPFWSSKAAALRNAEKMDEFQAVGINEQVFLQREYQQWFHDAGLSFDMINPRWDEVGEGAAVLPNARLRDRSFTPECLQNRAAAAGFAGTAARLILRTRAWRLAAHPAIFPLLRTPLLSGSQKLRLLVASK